MTAEKTFGGDQIVIDRLRRVRVDVAEKAQGDVVIPRLDPARAEQAAAKKGQLRRDIGRDCESENSRGKVLPSQCLFSPSSHAVTTGKIPATMVSTPCRVGWRPSGNCIPF